MSPYFQCLFQKGNYIQLLEAASGSTIGLCLLFHLRVCVLIVLDIFRLSLGCILYPLALCSEKLTCMNHINGFMNGPFGFQLSCFGENLKRRWEGEGNRGRGEGEGGGEDGGGREWYQSIYPRGSILDDLHYLTVFSTGGHCFSQGGLLYLTLILNCGPHALHFYPFGPKVGDSAIAVLGHHTISCSSPAPAPL